MKSQDQHFKKSSWAAVSAFTIVELAAVVALVLFLSLLALPVLARTKPNGKSAQCLNNLRQFTAAWTMYSTDNQERVPNNYGFNEMLSSISTGALDNWANNVMTWSAGTSVADSSNTNIDWITKGVLGRYLADPVRVYKCPADSFLSSSQIASGYQARLRSISMNSLFGRYSAGNDVTAQGINEFFPQYKQYLKQTSVLKPAKTWLVLDEHPDSINDGYFINNPSATGWQDIPASYHNGAASFAFADGHSELKRWQSRTSILPVRFAYSSMPFDAFGRQDFAWYLEHSGYISAYTGLSAFGY